MAASIILVAIQLVQLFCSFPSSYALYEDQIGKFDWRQQYVGNIKEAALEFGGTRKHVFVTSESNVLAGILVKTGNIAWRHVFPKGEAGVTNALLYTGQELLTVSRNGFAVRMWDPSTGVLQWEVLTSSTLPTGSEIAPGVLVFQEDGNQKKVRLAVTHAGQITVMNARNGEEVWKDVIPNSDSFQDVLLQVSTEDEENDVLAVIGRVPGIGFKVIRYNSKDGSLLGQTQIPAPWITADVSCITLSGQRVVCADEQSGALRVTKVEAKQSSQEGFSSVPLKKLQLEVSGGRFQVDAVQKHSMRDQSSFALSMQDGTVAWLKFESGEFRVIKVIPSVSSHSFDFYKEKLILTTVSKVQNHVLIQSFSEEEEISSLQTQVTTGPHTGDPAKIFAMYLDRKDRTIGSRTLLQTSDYGLHLIQQGGEIQWSREESLALTLSVEIVDLPVSETEAQFEDEFSTKKGDNIFSMFGRRISTQFAQLQSYVEHLKKKIETWQHGGGHHVHTAEQLTYAVEYDESEEDLAEYLTRDEFSLHKIIIVVTQAGKLFGLDSADGCVLWSYYLPGIEPITRAGKLLIPLMVQRTTAHFPNPPQVTIIAKAKNSEHNFIYSFNPINGHPSDTDHPMGQEMPFTLKQATMQNIVDKEFMKVILLIDTANKVYSYPAGVSPVVQDNKGRIYLYTADADTGALKGYRLGEGVDDPNQTWRKGFTPIYEAEEIWYVQLPSLLQSITHVVGKKPSEEIHSQGRVLGDRSVLYKYLNPNLVVVVSEGEDPTAKSHVTVYLIDVVTGNIVFQTDHKRVNGPVHVVHSENWVVYHFWNNRVRRNEITVLELFEGNTQKNSTAFSSLDPPSDPLVERQSYIFSEALQAMTTTHTEKGITAKHVLMALKSGGIISIPKRFLDPRRPIIPNPQHKEEMLIPYVPELVAPPTAYINYNQSVFGIENIHTSPAGLESTCLVLAYGLDFYFTRTTPSNLFDVLKEDFDYLLIVTVLLGLLVAAIVTRRLSSMKKLRQAWR